MTLQSEELALHLLFQGQDRRNLLVVDSSPLTLALPYFVAQNLLADVTIRAKLKFRHYFTARQPSLSTLTYRLESTCSLSTDLPLG